jgi:hypothetical protein
MLFSQRIGKTPMKSTFQVDSMDQELRNSLWNVLSMCIFDKVPEYLPHTPFASFFATIWHSHFKAPLDTMPLDGRRLCSIIREQFFKGDYLQVYDFVDFVSTTLDRSRDQFQYPSVYLIDPEKYRELCNVMLQRELAGYRFVGSQLAPITNGTEQAAIADALNASKRSKLAGVNGHLDKAVALLSDRKQPDYRNSIKESISAVESIVRVIIGKPSATLGAALTLLDQRIDLHPAMKEAFSKLYGYTSNEGGIRHAMQDNPKCDFEDAKYMLVTCSAFVNFLIGKAAKNGIKL